MAIFVAVCEIFSCKEWCDLEKKVRVQHNWKLYHFMNRIEVPISVPVAVLAKTLWGYFSPYSQSYHSFFYFFLCMQKSFYRPRAQAVEPILTRDTSTDAYSRRVVPFRDQRTIFLHLHPQNPQKPHFWAHTMENLCKIHIRITARSIEIRW